MTIKDAERMLEEVRKYAVRDPERAHGNVDELHEAVLAHIAGGGRNVRRLAEIALQAREIEFPRWCA